MCEQNPGFDSFPFRDFGFSAYSLTRPLVQWLVRRHGFSYGQSLPLKIFLPKFQAQNWLAVPNLASAIHF